MKIQHFFSLILCFLVLNSYGQTLISGQIVQENKAQQPIPNAVLITTQQRYFFSNQQGEFSFHLKPEEQIQEIRAKGFKPLYDFQVSSEIQLSQDNGEHYSKIKSNTIDEWTQNHRIYTNVSFKSLSKTQIQNSESNFILRKDIDFRITSQSGTQQNINAVKVSGLDAVEPKMITKDMFSLNWFQTYVQIFDLEFLSPFHANQNSNYEFHVFYEDSKLKLISFKPIKEGFHRSLEGVLIVDNAHSKFKTIHATLDGDFEFEILTDFDLQTGLPKSNVMSIKPGSGGIKLSFFGGGLQFGRIQKKKPEKNAQLMHQQVYYDFKISDSIKPYPKSLSKLLVDESQGDSEAYWNDFEYDFISKNKEKEHQLKSYIEQENINKRVQRISAFDAGYFPVSIFDIDLKRLFKINNYEGFRFGLGLQTNETFSEQFRLGGFTAYGTQDGNFKFGFNSGVLLNPQTSTWLNAFYDNDIEEVGMNNFLTDQRVYSLFEPRLVNITFFYKYEKYGLSIQHNFTPDLMSELKVEKTSISQTRDYTFLNNGQFFDDYNLTSATFGLRWTPNYTYAQIDKHIYSDNLNSPVFSAQISQSFQGVLDGDFSFTKLSAKMDHDFKHNWGSQSSIEIGGDIGFGDIPLMQSFHAFPNSPNKENILNRFSVAGVKSFETMYFNEFFSTRLATLHLKHKLAPFKISNTIRPELVFISRHAIGDFDNLQNHQGVDFRTLSQGFNEAGFELNKILLGFGLSFAYRYGAYHLPKIEDNIAFKFTFYLKL